MNNLLRIKHWQVLLFIFLPTVIIEILYPDTFGFINQMGPIWSFMAYVLWLYAVGRKMPRGNHPAWQINLFKCSFYYILFYTIFLITMHREPLTEFPSWQIPIHSLAVFASVTMLYFASKTLIELEKLNNVYTSDIFSTFIALWIFPIGVFFVQPRINRISQ